MNGRALESNRTLDGPTGIGTPDGAKLAAPGGRPGNGTSTGSRTIGGGSDTTDTDSGSSGGCNAGGGMAGSGSLIVIGLAAIVVALAAG